ncbi:hypothetical protein [Prosthecobacter sp.]|uniref:hypothetical protein n=1 Tax=Prosthecobacter sp. TaxID=1965333 RepID=UPI003782E7A6
MKFTDIKVFRNERCSIEQDVDSGRHYLSFPVFNGLAEYDELYEILPDELESILNDDEARRQLLEKSRTRKNDERLLFKPGRIRGSPC